MNKVGRYQFLSVFLLLLWQPITSLAQPRLKFKHISIEQGLSNSTIETIFQDSRGFMWFGTRDGLNRYDGNQMTVFRFNPRDSNSISDNFIRYLCEDRQHQIWVGTTNGLNRYDPRTNKFSRYKQIPELPGSLSHNLVTSIYEDKNGVLWIGTGGGGLSRFLPGENRFVHYQHEPGKPRSLSSNYVNHLYEDSRGNFWVGTENGLNLFNRESNTFRLFEPGGMTGPQDIRLIKEDRAGNLLLGTEENGLLLFNFRDTGFRAYRHDEKKPGSLASNLVRAILMDRNFNTWIGGVNGGLDLFQPATGSFHHYQNEPDNPSSLSQRTVSALFEDNQGNIWVGTHRGGINLYAPNTEKFSLFRQEARPNSLSYNDVKAFCEDRSGNIWIGTDGGGLNLYNPVLNHFRQFRYNPYDPNSIGSNEILDITQDREGNLWVATWGGGLCLMNPRTNSFTRFTNYVNDSNSISSNYVQLVFEDSRQNLWIGTYYGGLNRLDAKTRQFTRVAVDSASQTGLSGKNIVSLNEDAGGNIWIGTDDGGLNRYNPATGRFTHFFSSEEKAPDLRVIFTDSKKRLWVGQTGLYLFDPARQAFSLYTTRANLHTEFIKGIEEDEAGNFWISTSNGLTRFHPDNLSFKKYNIVDGLQGMEFEANASMKTTDGRLFFGGVNGFNSFHPENISANNFVPPVYITDFIVSNKRIVPGEKESPLKVDVSFTKDIHLHYTQSTFSFGFAALNYTALENNQYLYKLEGWDKDWNFSGDEQRANYTNVTPGDYTFRVKASNNDGVWNDAGAAVKVSITPPFWNTWWFETIIVLGTVAGMIAWYRLKHNLQLRKAAAEKKEEIHQVQLQFFTNISHEFRTPLSLILGPLEKLQAEDPGSGFTHYYQVMYRNANRLMNLINELMDFRKAETGALKLNVMPGNLDLFFQEIAEEFSELAAQKKIRFQVQVPEGFDESWFDRQVLEKIVINLISNSFKYTEEHGTIQVEVLTTLDDFTPSFKNELILKSEYAGKKYVYIKVLDNGIGISKESIAHLFERYYKITETHMGSGIGLAFVKSLTMLHKGNIHVYSERNKGTEIIIALPVGRDDFGPTERWVQNREEGGAKLESIQHKYEQPEVHPEQTINGSNGLDMGGSRPHILVVDDNQELREFLKEALESQYTISEAADGMEGLKKAGEEFPDLIISDVMMPALDGHEFCKRIKDDINTSHIIFLMLTAKDAIESRITGVGFGADYYFSKPLSIQLLTLTLRNIFQQRQKLKERYLQDQYADARDLVHSSKDKEFLEQLIAVIGEHLTNPDMDVDYICTQVGMSKTKLYQKIKKITGQSIGEFIRTIRFKKAAQIMTTQDLPLSEVMFSVGIQTQSYFTKAFKNEFGKTPTQFLKDLHK